MTVRRAHSENRVAILEGRSDLMTPWGVLPPLEKHFFS